MKLFFPVLFSFLLTFSLSAQTENKDPEILHQSPKLVVGVVVDQMRYDYLTRFWNRFGEDGFKRLITEGFNFKNNHYNYIPTYTGPGHASIFTGASPQTHGIISNNWYNKFSDEMVYCAGDPSVEPVGTTSSAGEMSPHRLIFTTIADQNRLHTQMRGKTIGIALKDRGSILPAGHSANAAYWFYGGDQGDWITSTYYMEELPQWVKEFNSSEKAELYMKTWKPLYDIDSYVESGTDDNEFEAGFRGKESATFPYNLKELGEKNGGFDILKTTPFGNSLTADFAITAIDAENLGQDEITDFLTVSFSSTDYVGHNFGVNSKEVEDTYLRLDQDLARLLKALDQKVGEGNYTLFLTADHGAGHVPAYLQENKIPGGIFDSGEFEEKIRNFVVEEFGFEDLIANISNDQVFFNYSVLEEMELIPARVEEKIAHFILNQDQILMTFTRSQLEAATYSEGIPAFIDQGFNQKRSGDVVWVTKPSLTSYATGSTHGTGLNYDTHVPLILFGKGIKNGSTLKRTEIIDIAPTISSLLGIPFPTGATGKPLEIAFED